ncbi:MAG: hypothetical protein HN601_05020 [Candidatus Marinimicrobia bacterium]|jgi:hypothetical protein|nr:hypothetical protein [Candidatus Neomarinimicrobiota bacterium]
MKEYHCIICEEQIVMRKNELCVICLEEYLQISDCCNAQPINTIQENGLGICSNCKKWSNFNEDTKDTRLAYRF